METDEDPDHKETVKAVRFICQTLKVNNIKDSHGFMALLTIFLETADSLKMSKPNLLSLISECWERRELFIEKKDKE